MFVRGESRPWLGPVELLGERLGVHGKILVVALVANAVVRLDVVGECLVAQGHVIGHQDDLLPPVTPRPPHLFLQFFRPEQGAGQHVVVIARVSQSRRLHGFGVFGILPALGDCEPIVLAKQLVDESAASLCLPSFVAVLLKSVRVLLHHVEFSEHVVRDDDADTNGAGCGRRAHHPPQAPAEVKVLGIHEEIGVGDRVDLMAVPRQIYSRRFGRRAEGEAGLGAMHVPEKAAGFLDLCHADLPLLPLLLPLRLHWRAPILLQEP
mmetsp:Transcript_53540/g.170321  ORF Transcript_53540/g.170321 Transcript_53540/m.170321 type:complete len:265 (+) Transcript_53540:142-936(+)